MWLLGISSKYGLKVTVLELVMVAVIAGKCIGGSLGTVNSMVPYMNDAGYDKRMCGLVKSSNLECLVLCILKNFDTFHCGLTMPSM